MKDYQKRLQAEFVELDERVQKLMSFFYYRKDKELNLSQDEVVDMRCQLYAMQVYRDALGRRCVRQGIEILNKDLYTSGANGN